MTADEYLKSLINKYRVDTSQGSPAYNTGNAIYPIIKEWASGQLKEVLFSGSYAKGTAIHGVADVDLFVSLKSDTSETLKEIFNSLYYWMRNKGYISARKQNVSIHIVHDGVDVDLVPAVHFGGNGSDHWLYVNKSNRERTKTNVATHIDYVKNSGRIEEIILTKIWRKNHKLEFPSFNIELAVIEALKYKQRGQLSVNFLAVLEYLANSFSSTRFVDPANTNNIISDELTASEKRTVTNQASQGRREESWGSILW